MKYTAKKLNNVKTDRYNDIARRQADNFERFMQEKAGVFQVTETKAQAMFWAMN